MRYRVDEEAVDRCHRMAADIAQAVLRELAPYSTVSIERAVARLLGVDGVNRQEVPLANVLVDRLRDAGRLEDGIALHLANACLALDASPLEVALEVAEGNVDIGTIPWQGREACLGKSRDMARVALDAVSRRRRNEMSCSVLFRSRGLRGST